MSDPGAQAVANEAYARWLGVRLEEAGEGTARVELPYREQNSNPGGQVNGGVVASALAIAARAAAMAGSRAVEPCAAGTVYLSVAYLASAVGEAIHAEGYEMRRGKELCHVNSRAMKTDGKPLGAANVVYRAAPGVDPPPMSIAADRSGDAVVGLAPIAQALTTVPFVCGVGIIPEQMKDGFGRLRLPYRESNLGGGGAIHEGAIAALVDVCGSVAAWSLVEPQRGMHVSTVGIDVNFVNPVVRQDLVARSRTVGRKRELFFNRVEIESADGTIAAYGSVIYRVVLPEPGRV